ncbi:MAG: alpha/beta fold hydrolase [Candidatus Korarchaeota archaeon]
MWFKKILSFVFILHIVLMSYSALKLIIITSHLNAKRIYLETSSGRIGALLMGPSDNGLHPAIITLHGFGWGKERVAEAYEIAAYDVIVLSLDLPDHGESTGKLLFGGEHEIVRKAVEFLHTLSSVDKSRVCIWGASYGGLLALTSGIILGNSLVHSVIAVAAPTNLTHLMETNMEILNIVTRARDTVPISEELFFANSPVNLLSNSTPSLMPKFYIIHGYNDSVVPVEEALQFQAKANEIGVSVNLILLNNTDHNFYNDEYIHSLNYALNESLGIIIKQNGFEIYNEITLLRAIYDIATGGIGIVCPALLLQENKKRVISDKNNVIGVINVIIFSICVIPLSVHLFLDTFVNTTLPFKEMVILFFSAFTLSSLIVFPVAFYIESEYIFAKNGMQAICEISRKEKSNFATMNSLKTIAISMCLMSMYQLVMYHTASPIFTVIDENGSIPPYLPPLACLTTSAAILGEIILKEMFQSNVKHEILFPIAWYIIIGIAALQGPFYLALYMVSWNVFPLLFVIGGVFVYKVSQSWTNCAFYYLPAILLSILTGIH